VKLIPKFDKMLVKVLPIKGGTSKGGIIIPDNAETGTPLFGRVLSTGPGSYQGGIFIPMTIQPGEIVMFTRFAGIKFRLVDEEHVLLRESEVQCCTEDFPSAEDDRQAEPAANEGQQAPGGLISVA